MTYDIKAIAARDKPLGKWKPITSDTRSSVVDDGTQRAHDRRALLQFLREEVGPVLRDALQAPYWSDDDWNSRADAILAKIGEASK